jgi:hypothetical protein
VPHSRLEYVRQRYNYRCGYCGVTEVDTGGELTVDHYHPLSAGGNDSDDNLVYACFRCNIRKSDFFPNSEELRRGLRVLHPLLDPVTTHYREDPETGLLQPLTETGRFHIAVLGLNRQPLVVRRQLGKLLPMLKESNRRLERDNKQLRAFITGQAAFIADLLRRLGADLQ